MDKCWHDNCLIYLCKENKSYSVIEAKNNVSGLNSEYKFRRWWQYYAWLAAYNVIYVIPLLAIVIVFTKTMGARKLSESEGRILKLVSGLMMLGFGFVLLFAPNLLTNALASILVLLVAVAAALPGSRRRLMGLVSKGGTTPRTIANNPIVLPS